MKNLIIFLLVFLLLPTIAISQNGYSIVPEYFDNSYNQDLSNTDYFLMEAIMENSSDTILNINWKIISINIPTEWGLSVSDKNMSYPPFSNITTNNASPIALDAGEIDVPFNIAIYHSLLPGCGYFDVLITLEGDETVLDTINYKISINDDCTISSVEDHYFDRQIELVPNPFVDNISINAKSTIQHVTIFSLQGESHHRQIINSQYSKSLNVSTLESGIYFLDIVFKNGERVVRKVIKAN